MLKRFGSHPCRGDSHAYCGFGGTLYSSNPDLLLDALDSIGLRSDGRLLALNSYENRVYQIFMEEGAPRVVKFYRAGRWSDAAILEISAQELAARGLPVVTPLSIDGNTLHHYNDLRFAVFAPRRTGAGVRAPRNPG